MAKFMLLGLFDNVTTAATVVGEVRDLGIKDSEMEIMSNIPYASKIFGRKTPRQWFLPFALGGMVTGVLVAFFMSFITPRLYPIEVGGQGLTPVPPSAIMYFEFVALFTMLGVFVGFLLQTRFPILTRQMYDERITEGYIGVQVLAPSEAAMDQVVQVFESHHAAVVKREDAAGFPAQGIRHLLFWGGLGAAGLVAVLIPLLLTYDVISVPWINAMKDTVVVKAQEGPRRAAPPEAVPIQGPVLIAGQPATERLPDTPESRERGAALFSVNCAMCHGPAGNGQGVVGLKHFPETPPLDGERAGALSDDDIFLVITNGKNRMPSLAENLSPGDTWDIVNYVRSLGGAPAQAGQ